MEAKLPALRAPAGDSYARCSASCESELFDTEHGRGRVWAVAALGGPLRFATPNGEIIREPVTCVTCRRLHAAKHEAPPPPSAMLGG